MTVITRVHLPASDFALRETCERFPEVRFEIERIVAHDEDHVFPYVWVVGDGADLSEVDDALHEDGSVADVDLVTDLDDRRLYRMNWVANIHFVAQVLVTEDGTILNARGEAREWTLRIIFPDRDALDRTNDFCEQEDLDVQLLNVYELDDQIHGRFGLTENQHEALVAATEAGYFDVPREASLEDVADDLGITHQALSERVRRGQRQLNTTALLLDLDDRGDAP